MMRPPNSNAVEDWEIRSKKLGFTYESIESGGPVDVRKVDTPNGERIVMIRPDSAHVISLLVDAISGKIYTLMVKETRTASAEKNFHFPAGSADQKGEALTDMALREFDEEAGIDKSYIKEANFLKTGYGRDFASQGTSNEQIFYFLARIELPSHVSISDLDNNKTGNTQEGEDIRTCIVPFRPEIVHLVNSVGEKMALILAYKQVYDSSDAIVTEMNKPTVNSGGLNEILAHMNKKYPR